ncbi:MAG: ABC transporter ATP-binding protein [Polyangiaceae bacterium]
MASAALIGTPPAFGESPRPKPRALLSARGLSKRFGSLLALDDVSFELEEGQIHCLLGENGAGKSTLCNLIFGVHRADAGELALLGQRFQPRGPAHALEAGVAMVHQHFSLVGNMTVPENLQLSAAGRKYGKAALGARIREVSTQFGFELDLRRPVEELSVGERQRAELVKCLLGVPRLLVLDEPTAVLPPREVHGLLEICRSVAQSGCAVLLVTHKLAEIEAVADHVSVLRRGRVVDSAPFERAQVGRFVRSMVGREVSPLATTQAQAVRVSSDAGPVLRAEALTVDDEAGAQKLNVSFVVCPGEIVGIAGVEGNGQSELCAVLSGMLAPSSGRLTLADRDVTGATPRALTQLGLGCVSEDRHAVGCHLGLSVAENLFLADLKPFSRFGLLDRARLERAATAQLEGFDVRGNARSKMSELSGGNQQKVVLARELSLEKLCCLLAAQPTRGLDVGAVQAVYTAIRAVSARGVGVLLVSSELDELLAVAHRVLVIYRGRIIGEVPGGTDQQEAVGRLMSGQRLESGARS